MTLVIWSIVFLVSLIVLIKASGYFTDAAEKIGLFLGIPAFLVGVTIVSVGTSLPELISSIFAVLKGSSEIVVGNVLGSNITNIFLVLGVAAIIGRKLKVTYELIHVDLPLMVGSSFLLVAMLYDGKFGVIEGLLCIAGFVVYLTYTIISTRKHPEKEIEREMKDELKTGRKKLEGKTVFVLIASCVFIYFGAKYTIESVLKLSEIVNIGKEIIAASAIALGTSFPELMVSITAAKKGKPEMAVGNVLGSNIFNAFAVMGIPALIGGIVVPGGMMTFSLSLLLIGMLVIATLLYFFITQDKQVTRWEGWLLVIFYLFFIGKLFEVF